MMVNLFTVTTYSVDIFSTFWPFPLLILPIYIAFDVRSLSLSVELVPPVCAYTYYSISVSANRSGTPVTNCLGDMIGWMLLAGFTSELLSIATNFTNLITSPFEIFLYGIFILANLIWFFRSQMLLSAFGMCFFAIQAINLISRFDKDLGKII